MHPIGRTQYISAAAIALVALAAFGVFYSAYGANNLYEFCHYADIAQNWAGGDGLSTRITEPGLLAVYEARGVPAEFPYPILYRFPLYSALVALSIRLFGFSDLAVCAVNGLVHAALAAMIVLLGTRLAGRKPALIAAAVFALHPVFAGRYAVSGFTGPLLALMLFALHYLLSSESRWTARTAATAGAVLGLAYLSRYNVMLFAPVYAVLAWRKTGWAGRAAFAVTACAVVSPIWIYNLNHFGAINPYPMMTMNLAAYTVTADVDPWRLYQSFSLGPLVAEHWASVVRKGALHFFIEFLPGIVLTWRLPLAFLLIFVGLRKTDSVLRTAGPLRTFTGIGAGLLLLQGIAFSPLRLELLTMPNPYYQGRYFFWFAPTLLLAAGAAWCELVERGRRMRWAAAAGAAILLAWPIAGMNRISYHFDPRSDPAAVVFRQLDPASTLLLSNMAFQASAYYRLNTIDAPQDVDQIVRMLPRYDMTHVYIDLRYHLTPDFAALFGSDPSARDALRDRAGFGGIKLVRTDDGRIVGLLLIRNGVEKTDRNAVDHQAGLFSGVVPTDENRMFLFRANWRTRRECSADSSLNVCNAPAAPPVTSLRIRPRSRSGSEFSRRNAWRSTVCAVNSPVASSSYPSSRSSKSRWARRIGNGDLDGSLIFVPVPNDFTISA